MELSTNDIIASFIAGEIQEDKLWSYLPQVVESFPESEHPWIAYIIHMKLMQEIRDNKTFGDVLGSEMKNVRFLDFMSYSLEVFSAYDAHEYMEDDILELVDDYEVIKSYLAADDKKSWLAARGTNRMNICRRAKAWGFDMKSMQKSIDSRKEQLFEAARMKYAGATELLWASERMKYAGAAVSVASATKYAFGKMVVDSVDNRFVIEDCSPELAAELKRLAMKLTGN